MSRPGPSTGRNLSLTEELEKLEQSITLTLQEIDHNFSKAHRIVTTNILPLVEEYGEHSRSVWESTKFWKQFFEASANVSLSGYEELANDENTMTTATEETTVNDETALTEDYTPRPHSRGNDTITGHGESTAHRDGAAEDSLLGDGDGDLSGSTPRPPATKTLTVAAMSQRPQFAGLGSPYEALKREMQREEGGDGGEAEEEEGEEEEEDTETVFQQHTARLPNMSMTPRSSLGGGEDNDEEQGTAQHRSKDPLLHRVLDKNYRILATPLKGAGGAGLSPLKWKVTAGPPREDDARGRKGKEKENQLPWQDSPQSSPEMAVPQLRSAAFMSPMRAAYRNKYATAGESGWKGPRTPGVSVQTPGAGRRTKDVLQDSAKKYLEEITWESDSDEDALAGMSPPKTIQFALPPSKLLQTPAREASKRIVDDILLTAGAELDEQSSEYSPTVVKMNADVLDDTF